MLTRGESCPSLPQLFRRRTNTYTWNARNALASITSGTAASFQYDPFGRRVTKLVGATTTSYLYDKSDIVQELSGSTPIANLVKFGLDAVLTRSDAGGMSSFLEDGLGSTLALTDSSGNIQTQY